MRVGIFGGSFNPIQNAHVKMAQKLVDDRVVDEVWIMPCKVHPLSKNVIDEKYRVGMINLAIANFPKIKICDIELKKEGTSYTYQTLRDLREMYSHDFYLVVGADLFLQMEKWHGVDYLKKEAKFIVFQRPGYVLQNPGLVVEKVISDFSEGVSSTEVRQRIAEGKILSDLVPVEVERYIRENKLYVDLK
ncbi:nicotinate-nucleotide adenylyltransferase [uncultured archaeon]|nr:nicotinate-nucleotide adenylyltransferase [uncultured archaeon]